MITAHELRKISKASYVTNMSQIEHDTVKDQLISIEHIIREQAYLGNFKAIINIQTSPRLLHTILSLNYNLIEYSSNRLVISW
jgi:hypothetical protein